MPNLVVNGDLDPFNFIPTQRNFSAYNSTAEAKAELRFKQPATLVYIIPEDTWYYWRNDIDEFVPLAGGLGPGASTILRVQDFAELTALAEVGLTDGKIVLVEDAGKLYRYDVQATSGDYLPDDDTDNTGWWIQTTAILAQDVIYNNGVSGLTATDVQAAIDELSANIGAIDVFRVGAGRDAGSVTNQYLRGEGNTPMNSTPFILPFNANLVAISGSTDGAFSWIAEVHKSGVLVAGATLVFVAQDSNYIGKNIGFLAGDKVQIYLNGTGISRPRVDLIFKRV